MARKKREPEPPRLVAVEGPFGVGKSAFVERWSERVGAQPVTIDLGANPFLSEVFVDPERRAFSAQMFFLLARHRQQLGLRQGDLFTRSSIVDYVFERDRLFAELLLTPAELALYERIFRLLAPRAVVPDLLVALRASPERLLERLRARDAPHERALTPELVRTVCAGYAQLFSSWTACPIVLVDVSEVELTEDPSATDALVAEVRRLAPSLSAGDRAELPMTRKP